MATDTMTSPASMPAQIMLDIDHKISNGHTRPEEPVDGGDNRSSSLSDIGESGGHHEQEKNHLDEASDANDTEAETERLEATPQKLRAHQNVLLAPSRDHGGLNSLEEPDIPMSDDHHAEVENLEPSSDISSLGDSGEDIQNTLSPFASSLRKRKRSSLEHEVSDSDAFPKPTTKSAKLFRSASTGALVEDPFLAESGEEDDEDVVIDATVRPFGEVDPEQSHQSILRNPGHKKSKRNDDRTINGDLEDSGKDARITKTPADHPEGPPGESSNEEEEDNDETVDLPDTDNTAKAQEAQLQKRSAFESLNAMEKCFATLRDKLFDERLTQYNEELAMLESPVPIHPELVAMKNVLDQRREQKVKYENTLLKLKLETLQRESIAKKAQAHSQYMQTARDIRESYLARLNKEIYQLQRERRNADSDVPEYILEFTAKRSQQIKEQTAYNNEISILSGVAKHVGFPAAPEIGRARPEEIEDDLRSMGISTQPHQPPRNPILRPASSFSRQRSGADEHFLEQNPWANPQHPSHHQPRQHLHRQASALSRTTTPSINLAPQTRIVDLTQSRDFASGTADHHSGLKPSPKATSPAVERSSLIDQNSQARPSNRVMDSAPSRPAEVPAENTPNPTSYEARSDRGKTPRISKSEENHSPLLLKQPSPDPHQTNSLPKPLPFMHTGNPSSTPIARTATPDRYTVVKAEEHGPRHSSMPRYRTPPILNGHLNRFAS